MNSKASGLIFLVAGVALLIWGISGAESVGSSISKIFSGTPTDKSMWLIIGGAVSALLGSVMLASSGSRKD
jgi:hypothetical protein